MEVRTDSKGLAGDGLQRNFEISGVDGKVICLDSGGDYKGRWLSQLTEPSCTTVAFYYM